MASSNIQLRRKIDLFTYILSVLFSLSHTFRKKIFDLPVYRAKIILRPCRDGGIQLLGEAERYLFFLHSLIQTSRVDNGLCVTVAAKHDEQIGYHCGLALLVKVDKPVVV